MATTEPKCNGWPQQKQRSPVTIDVDKESWLRDLETTETLQTSGELRHGNMFCCLGRLCETAGLVFRPDDRRNPTTGSYLVGVDKDGNETIRDQELGSARPAWMTHEQEEACVAANDALNWSFKQIAEWWRATDGAVIKNAPSGHVPDYELRPREDGKQITKATTISKQRQVTDD